MNITFFSLHIEHYKVKVTKSRKIDHMVDVINAGFQVFIAAMYLR